jgi:hypothetical protein
VVGRGNEWGRFGKTKKDALFIQKDALKYSNYGSDAGRWSDFSIVS